MQTFYNNVIDNIIAIRIAIALSILVVVFVIGSIGYHLIEDMGFFDGFYMTFITITTIGFAELTNLSAAGRIEHLREEECKDFRTLEERVSKHDFMKHINPHQRNTQSA